MFDFTPAAERLQQMGQDAVAAIPDVIAAIVVLAVGFLLIRLVTAGVRRSMRRLTRNEQATEIYARLTAWLMGIAVVAISITVMLPDFDFGAMVTALGVGGIAVGFALKDLVENFLAGLYILIVRPFEIGDVIEAGGHTGTIEAIEIRNVDLRLFNGELVIVPSALLVKEVVRVVTDRDARRFELAFELEPETDLALVESLALECVADVEGVLREPRSMVVYGALSDPVTATLYWWIDATKSPVLEVKNRVLTKLSKRLAEEGVHVGGPMRGLLREKG